MTDFVLIPALGCDQRLYADIASAVGNAVTIIADCDTFAGCVGQILAAAPPSFILLGTSFGGRVALELALTAPDRIKGLVVIGSSPGPSPDIAAGLKRSARLRGGEFEAVVSEMAAIISHLPGPNGATTRDAFIAMAHNQGAELMARQSDALAHRSDLRPRLASITSPALMIWGAHDQFVSTRDGQALAAALPRSTYVEIPNCGHFPPLEAPAETAAAIGEWLAT
jgi:pimeloyl-ACP methyl ester carboxylesterase